MMRFRFQLITLVWLVVTIALAGSSSRAEGPATKTLWVAHYRVDCVGVGPQKCMLVKEEQYSPWRTFYGQIEGFDYVEGYAYELRVVEDRIDDPPADGSSIRVKLVRVINRYDSMDAPAETVPMPTAPAVDEPVEEASPAEAVQPAAPIAKPQAAVVPEATEPTIHGIVRAGLGPETRSFQPCGAREETWVVDQTDGELWRLYRQLTGGATRPMYVEILGSLEPAPKKGFAANYGRQVVVRKIEHAESGSKGCDDE